MEYEILDGFLGIVASLMTILMVFVILGKFLFRVILRERKVAYIIPLGMILLFALFLLAYFLIAISVGVTILLVAIVFVVISISLYSWRREIEWIWKGRGTEYEDLIVAYMDLNDATVADCLQEVKKRICKLAEECMIAINLGNSKEVERVMQIIIDSIDLLRNHKMVYYVRLAFDKSGNTLSILNEHRERLRKIPTIAEKHPTNALEILENLIMTLNDGYTLDLLTLAESRTKELKHSFTLKNLECDPNEIILRNFQLWKECLPYYQAKYMTCNSILFVGMIFLNGLIFAHYRSVTLSIPLFSLLFYMVLMIVLFEDKESYVTFASNTIEKILRNQKKNKVLEEFSFFSKLKNSFIDLSVNVLLKKSHLLEKRDLEKVNKIRKRSLRELNYSILIYVSTTFPKKKIRNFIPLGRENMVKEFSNLVLEDTEISFLEVWKVYAMLIPSFLQYLANNHKKVVIVIARSFSVLELLFVVILLTKRADLFLADFWSVACPIIAYSGFATIRTKFWIRNKALQVVNIVFSGLILSFSTFLVSLVLALDILLETIPLMGAIGIIGDLLPFIIALILPNGWLFFRNLRSLTNA